MKQFYLLSPILASPILAILAILLLSFSDFCDADHSINFFTHSPIAEVGENVTLVCHTGDTSGYPVIISRIHNGRHKIIFSQGRIHDEFIQRFNVVKHGDHYVLIIEDIRLYDGTYYVCERFGIHGYLSASTDITIYQIEHTIVVNDALSTQYKYIGYNDITFYGKYLQDGKEYVNTGNLIQQGYTTTTVQISTVKISELHDGDVSFLIYRYSSGSPWSSNPRLVFIKKSDDRSHHNRPHHYSRIPIFHTSSIASSTTPGMASPSTGMASPSTAMTGMASPSTTTPGMAFPSTAMIMTTTPSTMVPSTTTLDSTTVPSTTVPSTAAPSTAAPRPTITIKKDFQHISKNSKTSLLACRDVVITYVTLCYAIVFILSFSS